MNSDELKRYFRKRINSVIKEFSTPASKRTEETFHELRVEIKKIKAFCELVNFCDKKFHRKKSLEPFKVLFDAAGKVRNLQVEEKIISDFGLAKGNKQLISAIHKKKDKAIHKFEKAVNKKLVKQIRKTEKKTEEYLEKIKKKELNRYYEKVFAKIQKMVKKPFEESRLHKTRMDLKEFLYNLKLDFPDTDKLIKSLDKLQESIGNWHDYSAALLYFTNFINSEELSEKEIKQVQTAYKSVLKKRKATLSTINQSRIRLRSVIKSYVK